MIDASLKKANILIVDDQESNIDVLQGLMEIEGYENIRSTTDPRLVESLFKSFNPDIILLDLSMPYLNGFEIMELLRGSLHGQTALPILVLTADVSSETKIRALSGGASDFLTKPFDLLEVGLRIRNLLYSSYLQQQLQNQNAILDEKVRERTLELIHKNVELSVAKEKAEASDRLKTSFINNISHEIRTPLNGIVGFGQILTEPDLTDEDKRKFLDILHESTNRLINTVTNFLEISMISSGNLEIDKNEIPPDLVINEIARLFRYEIETKGIKLFLDIPSFDPDLTILTDKELLLKILKHLVENAIKFSTQGSISLGYVRKEDEVVFYVKDTGKGISQEGKELIFKNFTQEDNSYSRSYEGCGLGLSIVKGLVELLGGKIWVESELEKGSEFYFSIPNPNVEHRDKKLVQKVDTSEAIQTILVAEDDEINFMYIDILLKCIHARVIHARNGEEAVLNSVNQILRLLQLLWTSKCRLWMVIWPPN